MNKIIDFFARIFSSYYSVINQYGLEAVKVIDTIRYIVEQDVFEKATAITETSLDDTALLFLRQNLGLVRQLVQGIVDTKDCFDDNPKIQLADEQLFCLLKYIGKIDKPEIKSLVWRNMARQHLIGSVPVEVLTNAGVSGNSDLNELIERSLRIFKKKRKIHNLNLAHL